MSQFDLYRRASGDGYWLDCQTDLMAGFDSRFVVPLVPVDLAPAAARHLNPLFRIADQDFVMLTQFAGTIPSNELAVASGSLAGYRYEILKALDFLITGV